MSELMSDRWFHYISLRHFDALHARVYVCALRLYLCAVCRVHKLYTKVVAAEFAKNMK